MGNPLLNRRTKGIIAAACGVALLFTGGTFALWSASENVTGNTLLLGDLNLTKIDGAGMYDVSTKGVTYNGDVRADQGVDLHSVCGQIPAGGLAGHKVDNTGTYRVTPADRYMAVYPFNVRLEGDNMVAALKVDGGAGFADIDPNILLDFAKQYDAAGTDWNVRFTTYLDAFQGDGVTPLTNPPSKDYKWSELADAIMAGGGLPIDLGIDLGYIQAAGTGQAAGTNDPNVPVIINTATSDIANLCLTVEVKVPNYANRDSAAEWFPDLDPGGNPLTTGDFYPQMLFNIQNMAVSLAQVRVGAGHFLP